MSKSRILVVDDEKINVDLIVAILGKNYDIKVAYCGEKAIEIANKLEIDLILLDISMPDIDGFEVAKRVSPKNIPIIFITSKTDEKSIEKAYQSGGSDYITKPIKTKELQARVDRELKLIEQTKLLKSINDNLESIVKEKTVETIKQRELLFHQAKEASMGSLVGFMAHQLKQPLSSISMYSSLLEQDVKKESRDLEDMADSFKEIKENIKFMSDSIEDLRSFFRADKLPSNFPLKPCVLKTISIVFADLNTSNIDLEIDIEDIEISGFKNQFQQVLINIIENSKETLEKREVVNPKIKITGKRQHSKNIIEIIDNGGGIPLEILDSVFEPYFTTKGDEGTGIGLHLCKMIIQEKMFGEIKAENREDGACFLIIL